jgi:hypothetical protein
MARNPTWLREELILALDLYLRRGLLDDGNPEIIELSDALNRLDLHPAVTHAETFRNPNGVAMKLANFASLDTKYAGAALRSIGKLDAAIWDEFSKDREKLNREVARLRSMLVERTSLNGPRRYWAFNANPNIYRIEEAVKELEIDTWATKGRSVGVGDRFLVWKSQGGLRGRRGVVALGEVIGDPASRDDSNNPYWVNPVSGATQEMRVEVKYLHPPLLPLWYGDEATSVLEKLSVSHGQGTIFNVTPEQWDALIEVSGGWPADEQEVEDFRGIIAEIAGKRRSGQGYRARAEVRRAIEQHAVDLAEQHYRKQNWNVRNVSVTAPYDLHCTRAMGAELRVEVKGTTSEGTNVFLTKNEVAHAHAHYPNVALLVVSNIRVSTTEDDAVIAEGGTIRLFEPWELNDADLIALDYSYRVPM